MSGPTITPTDDVIPSALAGQFRQAIHGHRGVVVLSETEAHDALKMLRDAGFTITFPEPRYYVADMTIAGGESWKVVDRKDPEHACWVARFNGRHSERFARAHAERLNAEVRP